MMKILLVLLVFALPSSWWIVDMHYNTLKIAYENDFTDEMKYELKLGYDYAVARYIIYNYPQTAAIAINKESIKQGKYIYNKAWLTYFIYPRKVIYE